MAAAVGRSGPRACRPERGSRPDGLPSGSATARRPVPLPTAALAPRGGGLRLPARSAAGAASAGAWFPERIGTRSPDPIRLGPFPGQVTPAPRASPRARAPSPRIFPPLLRSPFPPLPLVPPSLRSPGLARPGRVGGGGEGSRCGGAAPPPPPPPPPSPCRLFFVTGPRRAARREGGREGGEAGPRQNPAEPLPDPGPRRPSGSGRPLPAAGRAPPPAPRLNSARPPLPAPREAPGPPGAPRYRWRQRSLRRRAPASAGRGAGREGRCRALRNGRSVTAAPRRGGRRGCPAASGHAVLRRCEGSGCAVRETRWASACAGRAAPSFCVLQPPQAPPCSVVRAENPVFLQSELGLVPVRLFTLLLVV